MASQVQKDLEPWRELNGKVVMVTGASSGLGREFCLDLAKAGCRVVALARRGDRLKTLCDEINSKDAAGCVRAVAVELDIASEGATIERSVQKAWDTFGRIDVLINNAGFRGSVKSPLDLAEEEWNDVIRTNLTGSWLISKFVCTRMRAANLEGSVINISSVDGLHRAHAPGGVAYCSSKAALIVMTRVMALELGVYKIRVNSIAPGLFKSEITEFLMQKPWMNKLTLKLVPLRELGTTDPALTSLIRYLVHDSSKYVTGNIFIVDAGMTLSALPIFSSL